MENSTELRRSRRSNLRIHFGSQDFGTPNEENVVLHSQSDQRIRNRQIETVNLRRRKRNTERSTEDEPPRLMRDNRDGRVSVAPNNIGEIRHSFILGSPRWDNNKSTGGYKCGK